MDFSKERQKRVDERIAEIGQLAYEKVKITQRVEQIDRLISEHEVALSELETVRRNFDTYLAVKEGAITLDQLKDAIETGEKLK